MIIFYLMQTLLWCSGADSLHYLMFNARVRVLQQTSPENITGAK